MNDIVRIQLRFEFVAIIHFSISKFAIATIFELNKEI